jgi:hypothetical protein
VAAPGDFECRTVIAAPIGVVFDLVALGRYLERLIEERGLFLKAKAERQSGG